MDSQNITNIEMSDKQIMRIYKIHFSRAIKNLQEQYEKYKLDSEKHPSYNDVWQNFSIHLITLFSRNQKCFDINSEWKKFWERKLIEIYESNVDNQRKVLRLKFPISDQHAKRIEDEILKAKPGSNLSNDGGSEEVINIVSVCKLLSNFIYELGGLVPELIYLLDEALKKERNDINSCEKLQNDDNSIILLEKAKEKLTSALSNNTEIHHNNSINKAITNITKLLHPDEQKILQKTIIENPEAVDNSEDVEKLQENPSKIIEHENNIEKYRVIYSTPRITLPEKKNFFPILKKVHSSIDLYLESSSGYHLKPPEFWTELMQQNGNKNTKIVFPNPYYIKDDDIPTVVNDCVPENHLINYKSSEEQILLQLNTEISIEDQKLIDNILDNYLNEQDNNVIIIDDSDSDVEFVEEKPAKNNNSEIPKLSRKRTTTNSEKSDIEIHNKLLKI